MTHQRVAITGVGIVCAFGRDSRIVTQALLDGASAAAPISLFDASGFVTRIAAEVPASVCDATVADRKAAFALDAARLAWADAGLARHADTRSPTNAVRSGSSIGLGLELFSMADMVRWRALESRGGATIASMNSLGDDFLQPPADRPVRRIASELDLTTLPQIHVSACAASTDAIGRAFRQVRAGRMDVMLAGGADSMINLMGHAGFCKIEAMTTRNDDPTRASRPFDQHRDGFLLGEGAAFVVLEPLDRALARGAHVWGEVLGYGNSFDAWAISDPHPDGDGALLAMRRALDDAGLAPRDVAHVNTHGTSTPKNDPAEARALTRLFGDGDEGVGAVTVNATKSMLGHAIGASGAIEIAAQLLCARQGFVHGTINLDTPDPDARALCMPRGAWRVGAHGSGGHERDVVLKNSFAFGGQNACLALRMNTQAGR